MLMAPSFTNVLNVYAFCNLHDVTWGTKGADKPDALPAVKAEKTKEGSIIVEDTVLDEKQIEEAYRVAKDRALTRPEKVEEKEEVSADVSIAARFLRSDKPGLEPLLPYQPRRFLALVQRHPHHDLRHRQWSRLNSATRKGLQKPEQQLQSGLH